MKTLIAQVTALLVLGGLIGWWLSPRGEAPAFHPAPAAPAPTAEWHEPYGGCKEAARYPGTRGWRECRDHGLLPPTR